MLDGQVSALQGAAERPKSRVADACPEIAGRGAQAAPISPRHRLNEPLADTSSGGPNPFDRIGDLAMGELRFGNADDTILRIAASQHGLVARRQLLEIGVSADSVDRRLKRGWFRAMHRGVYAVGPVLAPRAREMAAALACGSGAALSHRSAAGLCRLLPDLPDADVAVTVAPGKHPRPVGIHLHRVRRLAATDVTTIDGIPVTTVARTLCDLGTCDEKILEQALAVALDQAMTSPDELESMLHRHRYRRGTARVRALLARDAGPFLTRSEADCAFSI
jgi:predicted transcriptional regulator of viral defense system